MGEGAPSSRLDRFERKLETVSEQLSELHSDLRVLAADVARLAKAGEDQEKRTRGIERSQARILGAAAVLAFVGTTVAELVITFIRH